MPPSACRNPRSAVSGDPALACRLNSGLGSPASGATSSRARDRDGPNRDWGQVAAGSTASPTTCNSNVRSPYCRSCDDLFPHHLPAGCWLPVEGHAQFCPVPTPAQSDRRCGARPTKRTHQDLTAVVSFATESPTSPYGPRVAKDTLAWFSHGATAPADAATVTASE